MSLLLAACAITPPDPTSPDSYRETAPSKTPAITTPTPGTGLVLPPQAPAQAPVPIDPVRPEVPVDMSGRNTQVDLWERVRRNFGMPDLDNPLVRDSENWYSSRPDYVARMTARSSRYLFHIVEEIERRGMPSELALLPFIESAFNPQAMSSAAASGMWQFIPSTGRDYSLKQNMFRDDRRDVLASTRAALDYLQRLYGMFGDWQLALAAYNWGEGSVQRAVNKNKRDGLPTDYSSLRMPAETAQYVPKLQAVKNIIANPAAFGLQLPALHNHPYFVAVPIERDIDVAVAARIAGLPLDEFKALNPQMNKPVILAAATQQVLLPYDNANQFVRELPRYTGPLASWTAWVVPRTMRAAEAAQEVGMVEEELREINRIPARMLIRSGSTLLVARSEARMSDVALHIADNATMSLAPDVPPLRRITVRAGRRDSVSSIAHRFRLSPQKVADWNDVRVGATFRRGESVVLFVPQGSALARQASDDDDDRRSSTSVPARDVVRTSTAERSNPGPRSTPAAARHAPTVERTAKAPTRASRVASTGAPAARPSSVKAARAAADKPVRSAGRGASSDGGTREARAAAKGSLKVAAPRARTARSAR
ncbi:transglycosylase SLT domain-containing protein [Schlegelella sp. ID0723]|uniref:Transglycosylase SLT domain-containing protein n=2 Tax=Piscinibacter koreensis TaxID=2742824 RepID=A0A7Y6TY15_9BURK|nr:transglycosylase SLT domain-containing protein [Schlegelella koreensis]